MIIELEQAEFGYGGRAVVRAERLALEPCRALGLFGPNGSGKTTLVRGITGLLPPLTGSVVHHGSPQIAYLPQHQSMESHWPMSGFDAAAMAISAQRRLGWLGRARVTVLESMRAMRVDDLADRPFFALSGGQQQRLLLAGAMAVRPQVLVLDEPTAGLDVHSRRMLLEVLQRATADGLCSVMISHEIEDLCELCDQVAWLHPASEFGIASDVETIHPDQLALRLTAHRGQP